MADGGDLEPGEAALQSGRWTEARAIFEAVLSSEACAEANFGLAEALWWLGENRASVEACVESYGSPFLYAECRLLYGGVLVAKGKWQAAESALAAALHATSDDCPGLHTRALSRLVGLRVRRLEEAERLLAKLDDQLESDEEAGLVRAALRLAEGDGARAAREQRLELLSGHQMLLGTALGLLVKAWLSAGGPVAAESAAARLERLAEATGEARTVARALTARGLVAAATDDPSTAARVLESALTAWTDLGLPYERAEIHVALAMITAGERPDLATEHARSAQAA